MKLTILVENNARTDNYLLSEPALSLLLEFENQKILFDTGYSDAFIKNAEKLNISLEDITEIVISHGHNDHTRGLTYLEKRDIPLIAHPKIFDEKVCKDKIHKGCAIPEKELTNRYQLILTTHPYWLNKELVFLGEIPNNTTPNIDDSALVYKQDNGIFIITGCSHSGIKNIVKYAKEVTCDNRIQGILGGFHLLHKTTIELQELAENLIKEGISENLPLYPCHCTDLYAKIELSKYFNIQEICTGDTINL